MPIDTAMIAIIVHGDGVAEPGIVENVAADLGGDDERRQRQGAAGQLVGRRLGAEGVAEEQDHRPEDRRGEDRQRDPPPVLGRRRTHVLRGLAPLLLQAVDGGRDDQDHQRDLEVQVDELQADLVGELESGVVDVEAEGLLEERGDHAELAEREHECQGQWHAREVRGDAGECGDRRPKEPRQPAQDDRVGHAGTPGSRRRSPSPG